MQVRKKSTGEIFTVEDVIINTSSGIGTGERVQVVYSIGLGCQKLTREAEEFFETFDFQVKEDQNLLFKLCGQTRLSCLNYAERKEKAKVPVKVDCDNNQPWRTIKYKNPCTCKCGSHAIPKRIDLDVYNSYKQQEHYIEAIDESIVKNYAMDILRDIFDVRCNNFTIEEKVYDNNTSDYFLRGRKVLDNSVSEMVIVQIWKDKYNQLREAQQNFEASQEEDQEDIFDD